MTLYLFLPMQPMSDLIASEKVYILLGLHHMPAYGPLEPLLLLELMFWVTVICLLPAPSIHQSGTDTINIVISQMEEGVALKSGWNL